jgi:hypothetical protein
LAHRNFFACKEVSIFVTMAPNLTEPAECATRKLETAFSA